ncbi:hypothetical protein GSI_07208 [Ganoderma sinense ZZ0214-1]|uniref:D-isomer specific 2-hydroxyacid dehydrogenase NAD-binding domain-containing protein n=1 Tax=Ganoderma sinense ZZ0214-1 TaxID=1077348 RepID=A0A2G8SA94_9APHY|nr:hypothetical protein GSI_07208 [Ganoderma sinense ZZ0214-1]
MIRKLNKGAVRVIVNTTHGKIIDELEAALIRALKDGHPEVNNTRLLEFPNATLLPHMGTETCDSQKKMDVRALTNLRDYLMTGKGSDIIPEHQQ